MFEIIAKGGFVMIPLIMCSVISFAVIIDGAIFWLKQGKGIPAKEFLKLVETGKEKDALINAKESKSSLITMLAAGLENKNPSADIAMESVATEEVIKMKKYLPAMDTIITLAPLLGLLGTIVGMIRSFDVMSGRAWSATCCYRRRCRGSYCNCNRAWCCHNNAYPI